MSANSLLRRRLFALAILLVPLLAANASADVLFRNVKVFDGHAEALSGPTNVLVRGNLIESISDVAPEVGDATVIDGEGMTLMPGLIDAHWHTLLARPTAQQAIFGDVGFINILAAVEASSAAPAGSNSSMSATKPGVAIWVPPNGTQTPSAS